MIDTNTFNDAEGTDIAIIGLAGRFPGAHNVDQFWQNLCAGVESITRFSDEELLNAGIEPTLLNDPNYVKAGAIIDDIDLFDAVFFGLTPKEAQIMDPQHRLFIETAWQALEDAGYDPEAYQKSIGLYAGSAISTYLLNNIYPNSEVVETVGTIQAALGNDKDSLTTRVAYLLNLTGPCYSVQTYCSTSLVAVSIACSSLLNGECDMALAGGVALSVPQRAGYYYQEGGIASPDARCRAFDAEANGAPLGNGVGIVVLKRLEDALQDGDHIYAVIKGSAINNDGSIKAGFTAPGVRGQSGVIVEALANADIEADSIDYVEAHGTGTPLGDAIELAALIKAFSKSTGRKQFCALGSVKTNVGHLDRAAGVTGLIKTSLALKHKLIPPSLNFRAPNTQVDLENSPFFVNTQLTEWKSDGKPRRAGVSAFGLGGTNAHVIVDEAPIIASAASQHSRHLLLLSAKSEAALEAATKNLSIHLKEHPDLNLADVAYTLQAGRRAFPYRRMFVCSSLEDAQRALNASDLPSLTSTELKNMDRPMAWMFAGVGEQYVGMGRELYEQETIFRQTVDQCCELAQQHGWLSRDLRPLLYPSHTSIVQDKVGGLDLAAMLGRSSAATSAEQALLQQTEYAQPAVFIIEYALAQLLLSWGLRPQALIGYSLGEYVAACVAGSLRLADALQLVCRRAQLIAALPAGSMLAVALSAEQVQPWLSDDISLAIINSARQCVLAGTPEAIAEVQQRLERAEIVSRLIPSSHAFHSPLLAPAQVELDTLAASIRMQPPQIPYLSNVTGDWISEQELQDQHYWSRHLCQTVHFASGVQLLWQQGQPVFVEIGPGQSLGSFLKQAITRGPEEEEPLVVVPSLRARFEHENDVSVALATLGKLWLAGVEVPWQTFWQDERRLRVPLPTYPFERLRHWIEAPTQQAHQPQRLLAPKDEGKKADPGDWFYQWQWQAQPLTSATTAPASQAQRWLVLHDGTATSPLVQALQQQGIEILNVSPGAHFALLEDGYQIRPGERADYLELCRQLHTQGRWPHKVVHAWSLQASSLSAFPLTTQQVRECQQDGLYSLLWLLQALEEVQSGEPMELIVLTQQVYDVAGTTQFHPEQAPLAAACTVVGQEYLHLSARCIDLSLPADTSNTSWVEGLVRELTTSEPEPLVAYRADQRYVPEYVPLHLARPQQQASRLRQHGVYLITGGFGAVGLVLAEYLARHYQARLVLLGRSSIPPRQAWQRWQAEHGPEDAMSLRLAQLEQLEQLGAEVLTLSADVADEQQMRAVVEQTYVHFGALHGVIHAAGLTARNAFNLIQDTGPAECEQHFQSKVYGLLALDRALEGRELDFCLLFSSLSAILGGLGFVAYTAANAFMDAYIQTRNRPASYPWLSINWDTWQVSGAIEQGTGLGGSVAMYAMNAEEGCEAFARVLRTENTGQIIHSTGDLQFRINQWIKRNALQGIADNMSSSSNKFSFSGGNIPLGDYEQRIAEIWCNVLGVDHVGLNDNFFDLGGNSLIALQVLAHLKKTFQVQIPAVALFEAPTVSALARYLRPSAPVTNTRQELLAQRRLQARQQINSEGVAIIGMTGRFPGADTIEQFWDNLRNGVESVSFFTEEELLQSGIDPSVFNQPNYVRARPILNDIEHFDAAFFGYSPREAELMDPQHRLFLECCWQALEHAGYDSLSYDGLIGVFGGANISTYMLGFAAHPELVASVNDYQLVIGNDKDSLTTGVSYKLNLKGPSFAVQTFCSTSLVAVHLASQSLLNGESDIALAGGVSIRVPAKKGHLYYEGGMESPDGHCRTFDANAHGGTFGDGVGIVVLKRLSDAVADGDTIYAVIKGSAINNDGALKVSYTAPSVAGQADVVISALQQAGLDADSIDYIEAHGTATELGDPIEVASLTKAFRRSTQRSGYCAIGSVKSNMGHLDRAAGVSGLLKTVLALVHEEIPASLHYQSPNPEIDFEHSPFFVNTQLRPWPRSSRPRRAGINSLGMGGTNVHVVLEEAPTPQPAPPSRRGWHLLPLSARTHSALQQATANLSAYLRSHEQVSLADIAYTLQTGRRRFEHRQLVLCRDHTQAISLLEAEFDPHKWQATTQQSERPMAWMFAGVGEQYVGMGRDLYEQEAVFRQTVDQCCELAQQHGWLSRDLRPLLYPAPTDSTQAKGSGLDLAALLGRAQPATSPEQVVLQQTEYAQPAVFIIEYALAQLLLSWGLRPQALIGYSLGEYVAACVAGSLSLPDALHLVCRRAQLIAALPAGSMLAVALSAEQVQPWLSDQVSLAIINSAKQCVLAGTPEAIADLQQGLEQAEIVSRLIPSSHAFHSPLLAPAQAELDALVASITMQPPQIPYLSNVTGDWSSEQELHDPQYWSRHMCQTVHFACGVQRLWQQGQPVFVEVGPGQSLGSFLKQAISITAEEEPPMVIPTLRARFEHEDDVSVALAMLGKLWLAGAVVPWQTFWQDERRLRVPLPTYPFERQRYWIDTHLASTTIRTQVAAQVADTPEAALENLKQEELSDWFYIPGWKRSAPVLPQHWHNAVQERRCWLIFLDDYSIGAQLQAVLELHHQQVITVRPGTTFSKLAQGSYCLDPGKRADYGALFKELQIAATLPTHIAHLWSVTAADISHAEAVERGYYSLLYIAQALGDLKSEQCQIVAISNDMQSVTGDEQIVPGKATILGPTRVIPLEYPTLSCRSIDFILPSKGSEQEKSLLQQLTGELLADPDDTVVALRGNRRWTQVFEPISLPAESELDSPLRNGGTYLITGGLGGIGLAIAEDFASRVQARLVLISRSGLPPRNEWTQILSNPEANANVIRQIYQIRALEELGSEVLVLAADVADEAQMRAAIQQTLATFGDLNGVVHAAGVPGIGLIQLKTPESSASVMAPKIAGTLALEQALQDLTLDFLVLFSSITSATGGGPGQVDYCAANAFLDAHALRNHQRHGMTIAINWGEWQWNAWQQGLSGYDPEAQAFFKQHRQRFGIPFAEGTQALQRALAARQPQVVVSTQDFRRIMELSTSFTAATMLQKAKQSIQTRPAHARPVLGSSYVAPRNEMEQKVTAIWEEILGVTQIGINDNFFELGGNSLIGLDLLTRLRQDLAIETIPSYALYEAPSVSALVQFLQESKTTEAVEGRLDRGEKRRENLKQRMRETRTTRSK